jgi:ABC-2 type transport system permease protein
MTGHPTRLGAIAAILRKDLTLFSRDLLFVFLTTLSIVTFVTLYWVLPKGVDETISIGVRGDGLLDAINQLAGTDEPGLGMTWFDDTESLKTAVEENDLEVGLEFADGFITDVATGQQTTVTIYVRQSLPPEITGAIQSMVREIAYAIAGYQLPVSEPDEEFVVLGVDRAGAQIPLRDRLRPLYAFMVLIMESISLAALIASEIHERTVTALLSTPARVGDIILAKGALGTAVAFSEAAIILLLIRAYGPAPLIVLTAILFGAIMVTSIAMIAGSAGRELMSTMLLGILFLVPLAIPGFSILFPGAPAPWVQFLPSYGIVQIIYAATVEGAGWAESSKHLIVLAAWCVAFALAGTLVLKRRVETL